MKSVRNIVSKLTAAKSREPQRLQTIGTVTIEAAAGDRKRPRISILAYSGGKMRPRGMGPVVIDLAGMILPKSLNLLSDHETTIHSVVGSATPEVRGGQLLAAGTLSGATEAGRLVLDLVGDGVAMQASVGCDILAARTLREGETANVNGRQVKAGREGLIIVTRSHLREISLVPIGADANTHVAIAATRGSNTDDDPGDDAGERTPLQEIRAEAAAEVERVRKIRMVFQREYDNRAALRASGMGDPGITTSEERLMELEAQAIAEGWPVSKAKLEVIRGSRPNAAAFDPMPTRGAVARVRSLPEVLEASVCLSAGIDETFLGEHYSEPVMNEALSARCRGMGVHAVLRQVLRAAGVAIPMDRVNDSMIRAAFEADRTLRVNASGFSTISLPGILGNVANKAMLESYSAVATAWDSFCAVNSNSDFKVHERYRMIGSGEFLPVGPDGELKHITLKEQKYTSRLETQGAMIGLTRQMIINDDLEAFIQLPRILGRMAAIALEKQVFTLLLANQDGFFSLGHKNYMEGPTTALSILSVSAAEQLFLEQVDDNQDPILVMPSVLLVPPALRSFAFQITNSTEIRDTTDDQVAPTGNPHAGRFKPVVSPWLSNASIPGSSSKAWYLATAPNSGVSAIEVAFLDGKKTPTIESGDTDFQTLGMQWRSFWDFGVAYQDHRGMVKSLGESEPQEE